MARKPRVMRPRRKWMFKIVALCLLAPCVTLLNGCSTKVGMLISANINPLKPEQVTLSDGYVATYYTVQKGYPEKTGALLFFVAGSGHVSQNYYLRSYFKDLHGNITIYALQICKKLTQIGSRRI